MIGVLECEKQITMAKLNDNEGGDLDADA